MQGKIRHSHAQDKRGICIITDWVKELKRLKISESENITDKSSNTCIK